MQGNTPNSNRSAATLKANSLLRIALSHSEQDKRTRALQLLLDNAEFITDDQLKLMYAIQEGKENEVQKLLKGRSPYEWFTNFEDPQTGETPVTLAVAKGETRIAHLLLAYDATNLLAKANRSGDTPLRVAIKHKNPDMLKLLREIARDFIVQRLQTDSIEKEILSNDILKLASSTVHEETLKELINSIIDTAKLIEKYRPFFVYQELPEQVEKNINQIINELNPPDNIQACLNQLRVDLSASRKELTKTRQKNSYDNSPSTHAPETNNSIPNSSMAFLTNQINSLTMDENNNNTRFTPLKDS